MNVKYVSRIIAFAVIISSIFMVVPLGIAFFDGQTNNAISYFISMALMLVFSICILFFTRNHSTNIYAQEGFAATGISWIVISLFGALPFTISGEIPHFIDALFEIVSGFTTTGASILADVEALPKSLIFWRSFTHWIGGMGVFVFVMAILPLMGGTTMNLMKAESTGPSVGKLVPRTKDTAKILY